MGHGFTKEEAEEFVGKYKDIEKSSIENRNNFANEVLVKIDNITSDGNKIIKKKFIN